MAMVDYGLLASIAEIEFADIVQRAMRVDDKLRIILTDDSYIDFWRSTRLAGRFAHHWERRHVDGTIFRHDNSTHNKWRSIKSFPLHFHNGSDEVVMTSGLSVHSDAALREFLAFARELLHPVVS